MLRSSAVSIIQQGLSFRSDQGDNIVLRLIQAQELLEKGQTLPDFLIVRDEELPVLSGDAAADLPERFIRVIDEGNPYLLDSNGVPWWLERMRSKAAASEFYGDEAGAPAAYVVLEDTVQFYPDRDQDYLAYWSYYKGAALLSNDIENEWLAGNPNALIGRAGMLMAEDLRNKEGFAKFLRLYQEAIGKGWAEDILSEQADDPVAMGEAL